jgi:biotin carboxylase
LRILHVDPQNHFTRTPGTVTRMSFPEGCDVVVGTSVGQNCHQHTDPLLAKLTVKGTNRSEALENARNLLKDVVLEGVPSNLELLRRLLELDSVKAGDFGVNTLPEFLLNSGFSLTPGSYIR